MTALEAQAHLQSRLAECRKQLEELFYYCEEEDLKKRLPKKGSWSITEVLFHINLVNAAYLKGMPSQEALSQADGQRVLKRSFLGNRIEQSMALKPDGSMSFKMKTPAVSDPLKAQKRGHAAVENVVFREIISDLDAIESYIKVLHEKNLEKHPVPTLFPILKVNAADALFILLEHELRHLGQAKGILG